eukprot:CAMPEP_0175995870 /NCGR_PEP_ID=MMETSP0108-20121206/55363_1 /TAXON_ID=195067 ORGANISM="Goniomonas pacifica, Strain CCMP1869" /NCGR_SAMPLE_ID=MMETSP0108 /ASSEMBLY_ACC=CAM_ASM_000204 /LENGTH=121 /DNA_ID=CAMNT_0017328023 /DNA_START=176 /DNA_END=538 /DNA_ORIENTATION=+
MAQGAQQQWKKMSEATDPGTEYRSRIRPLRITRAVRLITEKRSAKSQHMSPTCEITVSWRKDSMLSFPCECIPLTVLPSDWKNQPPKPSNKKKRNTRVKDHPSCARAEFCPRRTQGKHHAI